MPEIIHTRHSFRIVCVRTRWNDVYPRISEAASKLKGPIESIIPDQPWAQIRAVGNILRHEYDRVDPIFIWRIVDEDLEPLKAAIQTALERLRREDNH